MTTQREAKTAIYSLIDTAWNLSSNISSTVEMQYTNTAFDKPGELPTSTSEAAPFARSTVQNAAAIQSTQGKRRYLTTGLVTVQIFTPAGDGDVLSDALGKIILDLLRGHSGTAAGVNFFEVTPLEVGIIGPHFQQNVTAQFTYQEVISG